MTDETTTNDYHNGRKCTSSNSKQTNPLQELCLPNGKTKRASLTSAKPVRHSSRMARKLAPNAGNHLLPAHLTGPSKPSAQGSHNEQRSKPNRLNEGLLRLTMIAVLFYCLTTSDRRRSQVEAQASLLGSPLYLQSSSIASSSAATNSSDQNAPSSILKRDLSARQHRNGKFTSDWFRAPVLSGAKSSASSIVALAFDRSLMMPDRQQSPT